MRPLLKIRYLLVLCLWLIGFTSAFTQNLSSKSIVENAFLNLNEHNLNNKLALSGEWKMYWQQLIATTDSAAPNAGMLMYFPQRFDQTKINGKYLSAKGYATYALTIVMPKQQQQISMLVPDAYTSYRLYINNKLVGESGQVGTTRETTIPRWQTKLIDLPEADTLRLCYQVANFQHSKGGPFKNFIVANSNVLRQEIALNEGLDFALAGCFLMGAIFFISLYFYGQNDYATLYFALFCFAYTYRIIGTGNYLLHQILVDVPWAITIRIEYLTLFLSIAFLAQYIRYLYPQDAPQRIMKFSAYFSSAFFIITLVSPPEIFTQLITPFLIPMFGNVVLGFYVFIRAYKNKREGAIFSLFTIAIILTVFFIINLAYFGYMKPQAVIISLAYMFFVLFQALILGYRFSYRLKQARKLAEQGLVAKTEFLSTMSHEIRTPLNSVIGLSHLLLKNSPRSDQKGHIEVLLFSANNLLSIVNDILDFNKIEAGKVNLETIEMDVTNIAKNIVGGMKISAEDKGIELKLLIDNQLPNIRVIGDPTRLAQVLTNLVHNALKFTASGWVQVQLTIMEQREKDVLLQFKVEDTGIGIAEDKQQQIFERFTQADSTTSRSYGGTGLGLAICKRIIEAQGGKLLIKSVVGKGSVFFFTLQFPLSKTTNEKENTKAEQTNLPSEDEKPLSNNYILLVEDNPINVLVAQSFLQRWGATIDVATNGQEALDMLDVNKHQLILMDMHMPVMDGYEATRRIRAKGIMLPIIALTASIPKDIEYQVKETGMIDIVVKPFVPDDLYRTILHFIKKQA